MGKSGAGTPWGPMDTGAPDKPVYDEYATDANQFKGLDMSPAKIAAMRQIALSGGRSADQYMAGASKAMGGYGTQTSDMGRRLSEIATQTSADQNKVAADMALQEWQAKMQEMAAFNKAKEARNALRKGQYSDAQAAFDREQAERAAFAQAAASMAGNVIGSAVGG